MKKMKNIAVIGAGITGVTTAYALLERGFDVTVFDKNRYAGMETSFANGGQLSASNAEVWNQLGAVFKGIKWMFQPGAPLLVNPRPSWHKYSWTAEFVANIPNYRSNTIKTVELALAARQQLRSYAAKEGFEFFCEDRGILHVYRDEKEFKHARGVNALLREGGLDRNEVSAAEAASIEPAIKTGILGGFYARDDFSGDIHAFTRSLSDACAGRDVVFRYNTAVSPLSHIGDSIEA